MTLYINGRKVVEGYLLDGTLAAPALAFVNDPDCGLARLGADNIVLGCGGVSFIECTEAATDYMQLLNGLNFIGDTANANMAVGLTINQGAHDNEIMAFKSSDVAQPVTDDAEADTYGVIEKAEATSGGLQLTGYKDASGNNRRALCLFGVLGEAANTGKTGGSSGIIEFITYVTGGGTGKGAPGADANLISIASAGNTRFIFDQEGEMHSDDIIGVGNDWDDWDDLALAADLSRLPKAKYDEMMTYAAEDFEKAGLVTLSTDEDGTRHAFIKNKAMHQFAMCCFAEVYQKFKETAAELTELKQQMRLLSIGA